MPSLQNLRKRAKLYLRWHRTGYHPVAVPIRHGLARFRQLTDAEILAAPFRLSDAQELVARGAGFESWAAPVKGIDAMPTQTKPDLDVTALAAEPMIFVTDMAASCAFYADKLGFKLAFSYGEPPYYAQVARGGARLNLRHADGPIFAPDFRSRTVDALAAMITVADAKPFFLEFQAADVPFHRALRSEPWGARTFIVRDPDGNLIAFAGAGP